jgi:uncharacterized membrane protein (DUF485 family)
MADSSIDWEAIERSPDFRALVSSRRRFVLLWGGAAFALCAAMVLLAYLAPDVLSGAAGWIAGVALIVLTWVASLAYLRRSDRDWAPMEERVAVGARERSGRFERSAERERVR